MAKLLWTPTLGLTQEEVDNINARAPKPGPDDTVELAKERLLWLAEEAVRVRKAKEEMVVQIDTYCHEFVEGRLPKQVSDRSMVMLSVRVFNWFREGPRGRLRRVVKYARRHLRGKARRRIYNAVERAREKLVLAEIMEADWMDPGPECDE